MGLFSKEKTYSQEEMLTPEQKQAQQLLLSLSQGGNIAGLNLGDQYTGSLGNYSMTPTEESAVNRIYDLLNSGTPSALTKAEDTLTRLSDTTFDPSDPSSGYAAYQRQVARATNDANDVLNREAAITGNRFGDRILNSKSDLAAQQSDMLASKLAELYNTAQDRALAGAQGLTNLAGVNDAMQINRINTAANVGSLQRTLDTAKAQAQYEEWQRARNERLGTSIDAMNSLWNKNVQYGMKNLTTKEATPFGQLLNAGLTIGGTALGGMVEGPMGAAIGGSLGSAAGGAITGIDNSGSQSQLMGLLGQSILSSSGGVQGGVFPTNKQYLSFGGNYAGATPKGYTGTIQRF